MSDYKVELADESSTSEFFIEFKGPKDSPYENGVWKVHVELPAEYPFRSPSIGFVNRIFHPNVDEMAGSVCLDVINQTWSPMYDLVNVFEIFLPQLLLYPNPADPLNGDAASLLMRSPEQYKIRVKDYVERYAKQPDVMSSRNPNKNDSEGEGEGAPKEQDDEDGGFLEDSDEEMG